MDRTSSLLQNGVRWLRKTTDCLLTYGNSFAFLRSQYVTKNRRSFAGSQTLLASENELNSTGNYNSTETVRDARRLLLTLIKS